MKFNITVGAHAAQVEINPDGKGGFTGVITHTQYGDGQITNGVETGDSYKGQLTLDGHNANFSATLSGQTISGVVAVTGFAAMFAPPANFTGTAIIAS